MDKKVYALYHKEPNNDIHKDGKYEIKISCQSHWMNQADTIKKSNEQVVYHNSNYFLSFSRAALVKKAREIQAEWIEKEKRKIAQIESIKIK